MLVCPAIKKTMSGLVACTSQANHPCAAEKNVYVAMMQSVLYECGPHLGCAQGLDCPYAATQRVSKADAQTAAHKLSKIVTLLVFWI